MMLMTFLHQHYGYLIFGDWWFCIGLAYQILGNEAESRYGWSSRHRLRCTENY